MDVEGVWVCVWGGRLDVPRPLASGCALTLWVAGDGVDADVGIAETFWAEGFQFGAALPVGAHDDDAEVGFRRGVCGTVLEGGDLHVVGAVFGERVPCRPVEV